jgi:hypothetical protein
MEMSIEANITGRCLCGAVSYAAKAQEPVVDVCHCTMCRRWGSGPLFAIEVADPVAFQNEDQIGIYRSSEWGERGFCKLCGTALYWRLRDGSHTALCVGTLDREDGLRFATEIFIDEKPAYYDFANATTRLTGQQVMAMFGAQPEKG